MRFAKFFKIFKNFFKQTLDLRKFCAIMGKHTHLKAYIFKYAKSEKKFQLKGEETKMKNTEKTAVLEDYKLPEEAKEEKKADFTKDELKSLSHTGEAIISLRNSVNSESDDKLLGFILKNNNSDKIISYFNFIGKKGIANILDEMVNNSKEKEAIVAVVKG